MNTSNATVSSANGSPCAPIALTMGEPAGIGGDITLMCYARWRAERATHDAVWFVIDDPVRLKNLAQHLGMDIPVAPIHTPLEAPAVFPHALPVLPLCAPVRATLGTPQTQTVPRVLEAITKAVTLAQKGEVAAIVTNPIHKGILYEAGFPHPGHTEYLSTLTNHAKPVMMLCANTLRVVPISIHEPLQQAVRTISTDAIVQTACITHQALVRDFSLSRPRMAMAGLNPHAGEDGIGREEADIIMPAVEILRAQGLIVTDPIAPDALFTPACRKTWDVALCHYHDQALIPIKALAVHEAVNVTLGLPLIRTSPDHGTALTIAGQATADPRSLLSALHMAADLARHRTLS